MCLKRDFKGRREDSSKKKILGRASFEHFSINYICTVIMKNCSDEALSGNFFFVIPRVGHGKHVLNTLSGSDRRNLVRKIKKGMVLTEEIREGILRRS